MLPLPHEVIGIFYILLLLFSPLPLLLYLIQIDNKDKPFTLHHSLIAIISGWCGIQIALSLIMGLLGVLFTSTVFWIEVGVFTIGSHLLLKNLRNQHLSISVEVTDTLEWGIWGIVLFFLIGWFFYIAKTPITNFDTLYYHLPMAVNFFQTGTLTRLIEYGQISYYPYHWELLSSLFLIASENDQWVALPNVFAWMLTFFSLFALSIELKISRVIGLLFTVVVTTMPILFENINSLHVDLPAAAFFVSAIYLAFHFRKTRSWLSLVLVLTNMGLIAGIKMSGLAYLLLILLWWFLLEKLIDGPKLIFPPTLSVVFGILGFCFLSGVWYLLNFVQTGNPMGLISVGIGSFKFWSGYPTLNEYLSRIYPHFYELNGFIDSLYGKSANFDEYIQKTTLVNLFQLSNLNHWRILIKQIINQCGYPFIASLFIFFINTFLLLVKRLDFKEIRFQFLIFTIWVLTLLLYWFTPYSGDNGGHQWQITDWIGQGLRYALPGLFLVGLLSGSGVPFQLSSKHRWLRILFIGVILFLQISQSIWIVSSKFSQEIFGMFISIATIIMLVKLKNSRKWFALGIGIAILGLSVVIGNLTHQNHFPESELSAFIKSNIPSSEKMGYLISFFKYPLYGSNLKRSVQFAPAYTNTCEEWVDNLKAESINWIAIGPFRDEAWFSAREVTWLENPQCKFKRVFGTDPRKEFVIYKTLE